MGIDYAETHYHTLRFSFAKMFLLHATKPAWRYNFAHLPAAGSHSISSYLRLKPETYNQVLSQLGLAYNHGKSVRISFEKLKRFQVMKEYPLPDCYQAREYGYYNNSRRRMIQLGGMNYKNNTILVQNWSKSFVKMLCLHATGPVCWYSIAHLRWCRMICDFEVTLNYANQVQSPFKVQFCL